MPTFWNSLLWNSRRQLLSKTPIVAVRRRLKLGVIHLFRFQPAAAFVLLFSLRRALIHLISEVYLRPGGAVTLPRGFFTPKVGPHGSSGFAPGMIFAEPPALRRGELKTETPPVDYVRAKASGAKKAEFQTR
jgi:hypothetical protein